jgi:hypothetical protein
MCVSGGPDADFGPNFREMLNIFAQLAGRMAVSSITLPDWCRSPRRRRRGYSLARPPPVDYVQRAEFPFSPIRKAAQI